MLCPPAGCLGHLPGPSRRLARFRLAAVWRWPADVPRLKRVYEPLASSDGRRILVDRVWPRGLSKEEAHVDEWLRDLAPSTALRKWFGHDPVRWQKFRQRYRGELAAPEQRARLERIRELSRHEPVTLLYGEEDREHNQAVVLTELLHDSRS